MKNYYDMSKVDFVVDRTEPVCIGVAGYSVASDGEISKLKQRKIIDVQINGSRFTLEGKEADRFIEKFEEYQQNKGKGGWLNDDC